MYVTFYCHKEIIQEVYSWRLATCSYCNSIFMTLIVGKRHCFILNGINIGLDMLLATVEADI